jgi:hypothetical protein
MYCYPEHGLFRFWRKNNLYKIEVVRVNPEKSKRRPHNSGYYPFKTTVFPEVGSSYEGIRYTRTSSPDPAQGYPIDRFEC